MASVKVIHKMIDEAVMECAPHGSGFDRWQRQRELNNPGQLRKFPALKRANDALAKAKKAYEAADQKFHSILNGIVDAEQKAAEAKMAKRLEAWKKVRDMGEGLKVDVALDRNNAAKVKDFLTRCRKGTS